MPIPNANESREDFISRCIPIVTEEGTAEDSAQASAICHTMYDNKDKSIGNEVCRMGNYIRTDNGNCILEDDIHCINFDTKLYSLKEIGDWLIKHNLTPYRVKKLDENIYSCYITKMDEYMQHILSKKYFKPKMEIIQKGIRALCVIKQVGIQSITFDKTVYSVDEAKVWLDEHDLDNANLDEAENEHRFRQFPPDDCKDNTFGVREVDEGINFVFCQKKSKNKMGDSKMAKVKTRTLFNGPQTIYSHVELKSIEKGKNDELIIEGFASTGEIDRDQDIVDPKAFKNSMNDYMENPILCYMHDWTQPIGSVLQTRILNPNEECMIAGESTKSPTGGLHIRASISKSVPNIRELIKERVLKAFSIGFLIKEAEFDEKLEIRRITDVELFEISVVSIPSNRRSLFSLSKALKNGTDIISENDADDVKMEISVSKESENFRKRILSATKTNVLCLKNKTADEVVDSIMAFNETKDTVKELESSTFTGTTDTADSESISSHTHEYTLNVTRDETSKIVEISGLALASEGHEHPISEVGETAMVNNHFHTFTVDLESAPKDDDDSSNVESPNTDSESTEARIINQSEIKDFLRDDDNQRKCITKYALLDRYLNMEAHDQKVMVNKFIKFKTALLCKALKTLLDGEKYKCTKTINFDFYGKLARPQYAYMEVGRDNVEELLIDGFQFISTPYGKFVINVYPIRTAHVVDLYHCDKQTKLVKDFSDELKQWMDDNNFYKGEKITPNGKFLPLVEMTFDDIKLPEDDKKCIKVGALDFFEKKELYQKGNIPFKRGLIFAGEPGTGKTLTGRILMSQVKSTFIWATSEDLYYSEDFKYLMIMAKELAPCIIFAEDIDNYLKYSSAIDVMKTHMDGMEDVQGIVTILCTNYPKTIPPSLIDRPSRFDDVVEFNAPDEQFRYEILEYSSKHVEIEDRAQTLKAIAKEADGLTGAHLKELIIYSMLLAFDNERTSIIIDDLNKALEKINKTRDLIITMNAKIAHVQAVRKMSIPSIENKGSKPRKLKKPKKTISIPQDILNDIIETMILKTPSLEKLSQVMEYFVDMLEGNSEQANVKYLLKQANSLLKNESKISEEAIRNEFSKILNKI